MARPKCSLVAKNFPLSSSSRTTRLYLEVEAHNHDDDPDTPTKDNFSVTDVAFPFTSFTVTLLLPCIPRITESSK
ncbi:unnamed protein product [Arabis nemorensis]|uniref:Uncharacterized protein n=1 Tax=Arabis nemorensis TaxID=586526 RepID=A0A565B2Q8_9BRAS|nr:unnamed protein product [Arabis nemorensis]